jgi:hypothetical protein
MALHLGLQARSLLRRATAMLGASAIVVIGYTGVTQAVSNRKVKQRQSLDADYEAVVVRNPSVLTLDHLYTTTRPDGRGPVRSLARGALAVVVSADCPGCPKALHAWTATLSGRAADSFDTIVIHVGARANLNEAQPSLKGTGMEWFAADPETFFLFTGIGVVPFGVVVGRDGVVSCLVSGVPDDAVASECVQQAVRGPSSKTRSVRSAGLTSLWPPPAPSFLQSLPQK